jgi:IS5 family transposase
LVERGGIPLAVGLSAANTHDSVLVEAMVDSVAPVKGPRGRPGRPRRRPAKLHLDKGCDDPRCRRALRRRGIIPRIARRGIRVQPAAGPPPLRGGAVAGLAIVGYRRLQVATSDAPTSSRRSCSWPARSCALSIRTSRPPPGHSGRSCGADPGGCWVAHRGLAKQRVQLTASSTACCWDRPWSATRRCQV